MTGRGRYTGRGGNAGGQGAGDYGPCVKNRPLTPFRHVSLAPPFRYKSTAGSLTKKLSSETTVEGVTVP
ncbi:hypothetical protein E2C01_081282 [Portunus trituberculatus]|uniref:Uncharacterized protein n=1 Tax=Portunus trituberculatus TaxID=210409 RepID=A0A5B7IVV4_PORTR|nr:hypothetical protein [Portunus trituberculatus]